MSNRGMDKEDVVHRYKEDSANPKRNQPEIFIGRTDAESPILWLPDAKKYQLIGKDSDAGKD